MDKMRLLGGTFLVTGVAIGAGMLAIPAVTAAFGFYPTMVMYVVTFFYILLTSLLVLEANLAMPAGSNIISMSKQFLGAPGKMLAWLFYLLLLYALNAAYTTGGGRILQGIVEYVTGYLVPAPVIMLVFLFLFGTFIYFGTRPVDYINRVMMAGLIIAYLALVVFVTPHVEVTMLHGGEISYIWYSIPILVLAFCAQLIVPTLRVYHHGNTKELTIVLILGVLIPFVFYALWELTILGIVPVEGEAGLNAINHSHNVVGSIISALSAKTGQTHLGGIVGAFSFFALVTSFLGCSLSLMHFLKDGFALPETQRYHILNVLLTFIPGYLFAIFAPHGFIIALSYAGVFVAILFGIFPILMVWRIRYIDHLPTTFRVPGGKPMLVVLMVSSIVVVVVQILSTLKMIPIP